MLPNVPTRPLGAWYGGDTPQSVTEKVIGENTLRPVAFVEQASLAARSICLLIVGDVHTGSGFMVSPQLLLTCEHVLPSVDYARQTIFRFNYQLKPDGLPAQEMDYRMTPNGVFRANTSLDYAIVEIDGEPGHRWGWLSTANSLPLVGQRLNIIQHPAGQRKQISMQNNFLQYVDGEVLQYTTTTLPGSSGSPVLNNDWKAVGLHHAGGDLPEPTTQKIYFRNEGVSLISILNDLPQSIRDRIGKGE